MQTNLKKDTLQKLKQRLSASFANSAELMLAGYEVGQEVKVDTFAEGDIVDITGVSKGKGFQGVIKRHGYSTRTNESRFPFPPFTRFKRFC